MTSGERAEVVCGNKSAQMREQFTNPADPVNKELSNWKLKKLRCDLSSISHFSRVETDQASTHTHTHTVHVTEGTRKTQERDTS